MKRRQPIALVGFAFALGLTSAPVAAQVVNQTSAADSARKLIAAAKPGSEIPALSVAVAVSGRVVWSEAFGLATFDPPLKATTSTLFRVGSVSKPITTAALMRLRESGRVDLDSPVRRYVPEFPAHHAPITLRQLAGHLSGIRHYRGAEFSSRTRFANVIAALDPFKDDSLLFSPGTRFEYSTYGYTLLSAAMERAAEVPFLAFVDSVVARPLGLRRTVPDYADSTWADRATFYYRYPQSWQVAAPVDQSNKWAGGGYLSTAEDLARFGAAVLRPGFLTQESRELLFAPAMLPGGSSTGYGLGWFVEVDSAGHRIANHGGSSVGGTAMLSLHPEAQVVVSVLVNAGATRAVNRLTQQIAHLFLPR
jgi:serine beta-lactamase-like protein LACTB